MNITQVQTIRKIVLSVAIAVAVFVFAVTDTIYPSGHAVHELVEWIGILLIVVCILGRTWSSLYIAGRIKIAGGNSVLVFTRQAVDMIYQRAAGIPRLISVICDNALISGFAADRRPVSRDIIEDVCRDFDLSSNGKSAAASAGSLVPAQPAPTKVAPVKKPVAPEPAAAEEPGSRGMFEAAGFAEVSQPTKRRVVMRIDF